MLRRFGIKLVPPSILNDHHSVVVSRCFQRYVTRSDVGENFLRRAIKRSPESAAAGGFDRKTIALCQLGGVNFTRGKSLNSVVIAADENAIRQRLFAAV
jgi:hypothetical protein